MRTSRSVQSACVTLLVSLCTLVPAARAQDAQSGVDPFTPGAASHVRDRYLADLDTVYTKTLALANAIPADKYSWRPAPGVRSVSEALMHVASEFYFYAPKSVGGNPPADFGAPKEALPKLETITAKAQVIAELQKSWAHTKSELASRNAADLTGKIKPWGLTIDETAFVMTGDLHEHLGQLITYARSVGVKPPWSK